MSLGRIEDYNKVLPIVELYTCVQSEGSRAGRPTVAIRTTGCTHRCYFGEGGWCDSWYTSIHPGKGTYTFNDIIKIYDENPTITEMMLTGGSPTMQPDLCNELTHFANERGIFITIETEGSHFVSISINVICVRTIYRSLCNLIFNPSFKFCSRVKIISYVTKTNIIVCSNFCNTTGTIN